MRKVKYEDYLKRRESFIGVRAALELKKGSSSKNRDELERGLLTRLDQARLKSWEKNGKLTRLGPRKYRLDVGC